MKNEQPAPLAGIACCEQVPDYHPPVAGGAGALRPGDILDDRFVITEVISRSGMALIFRAQDLHDRNADVAVKMPHAERPADPAVLTRFQREEEIGLGLNHPFILKFIPITTSKSRPYLVTEYLRGCTLAHLLEAMSPLPENDALKIGSLVGQALHYLHRKGVTHCDLNPNNIMVGCDGTIRLLDFGLARSFGSPRLDSRGPALAMGTPDYMAPEQIQGGRVDARTDLYCLGALLYEMLAGRPPFEGDCPLAVMNARLVSDPAPLRTLNPAVSPQAEEIVLHALEREPAKRHRSARSFCAELDAPARAHLSRRGPRRGGAPEFRPHARRYRRLLLALALPLALQVAAALWLLLANHAW